MKTVKVYKFDSKNFKKSGGLKKTSISVNGLRVFVKILDFKSSYGHNRWLVTPIAGEGEVWTENIFPIK